jgi:hypothetical protein
MGGANPGDGAELTLLACVCLQSESVSSQMFQEIYFFLHKPRRFFTHRGKRSSATEIDLTTNVCRLLFLTLWSVTCFK